MLVKRTKYRKYHRGRMRGKATRGNEIFFDFGLQALEPMDYVASN
jgi:large subunit ribosomal protein L16